MSAPAGMTPEQKAREAIDAALAAAGWIVQNREDLNLSAGRGVAVREFPLTRGNGFADYLLFVDGRAVGVLEAKPAGHTLTGVEPQAARYATGLPAGLHPPVMPLPFLYLSTGERDPVHQPARPRPAQPRDLPHPPPGHPGGVARRPTPSTPGSSACTWTARASTPPPTTPGPRRSALGCGPCRRSIPGSLYPNQIRGHHEPGAVAPAQPPPRPDPDGHRARARRSWRSPPSTG